MSLDSVTRIDTFFQDQITTPESIYTIFEDKNEGLFEGGGGPFVKIWTEASFDDPTAVQASPEDFSCYTEDGIVIIQIFATKGMGTQDLYSLSRVVTLVRDAFRGKRILPTGSEEGIIYFEDISTRQTIEIAPRDFPIGNGNSLGLVWKRKDIFINYQKNYAGEAVIIPIPVNTAIPVVTADDNLVGTLRTTDNGTWTNSPISFTYRWLRDDVAISGATSITYTPVIADDGAVVKSEVVAINAGGPSLPAESVGTAISSGAVTRNFTTLNSSLSMHYTFPAATHTADFYYEIRATKNVSDQRMLLGSPNSNTYLFHLGNGALRLATPSGNLESLPPVYTISDQNIYGIRRIGTTLTLEINGTTYGTFVNTDSFTFDKLGTWDTAASFFWDGIISDVKITDAGTLIRDYPIDETWAGASTVLIDNGTDGLNGTAVNIVEADSENFTFNGAVSPNTWTNDGATIVIEVAGT